MLCVYSSALFFEASAVDLKAKVAIGAGMIVGSLYMLDAIALGALTGMGPGYKGFGQGIDIAFIKHAYQKISQQAYRQYLARAGLKGLLGSLIAGGAVYAKLRY